MDNNGHIIDSLDEMGLLLQNYFSTLFKTDNAHLGSSQSYEYLQFIDPKVIEEDNAMRLQPFLETEIFAALQSIGSLKSSTPDGFHALFYKKFGHLFKP